MPRDVKLPVPTAKEVNEAHRAAWAAAKLTVKEAIRCGQMLAAKKAELDHGKFKDWVETYCEFSYRSAAVYMKAAASNSQEISSLRSLFDSEKKTQVSREFPIKSKSKVQHAALLEAPKEAKPKAEIHPEPESSKPDFTTTAGEVSGLGNPTPHGQFHAVSQGVVPDPDEPERPDDVEELAAIELAETDLRDRTAKIMDADDRLAEAYAQLKQQADLLAAATLSRDGYMNGKAEITKLLKAEQRKNDRLEKENKKLRDEIESYKERIAIMEAA